MHDRERVMAPGQRAPTDFRAEVSAVAHETHDTTAIGEPGGFSGARDGPGQGAAQQRVTVGRACPKWRAMARSGTVAGRPIPGVPTHGSPGRRRGPNDVLLANKRRNASGLHSPNRPWTARLYRFVRVTATGTGRRVASAGRLVRDRQGRLVWPQRVAQSFRSFTRAMLWSASFSRMSCALSRVGKMFSRRFGPLISRQMRWAVAVASSSVKAA